METFFTTMYEFLYYQEEGDFSLLLTEQGIYADLAVFGMSVTILLVLTFYFFINQPVFNRGYHWMAILSFNTLLNIVVAYILINSSLDFDKSNGIFMEGLITLSALNAMYATLSFIFLSTLLSRWSKHARYVPFRSNLL